MENEPVTADKTPDQIEREMQDTRNSITEKVAALETQVLGTVQNAADTLTGTVDAVKAFVENAPDTVKQSVESATASLRETFDISAKVRDNPWAAVGVAAAAGALVGWLTAGGKSAPEPSATPTAAVPPQPAASAYSTPSPAPAPARSSEPGPFDAILGMVVARLRTVAEAAIDSATQAATQAVTERVPKLIDTAAEHLTPEPPRSNAVPRPNGRVYAG